jgi:hypothetical protein
VTADSLSFGVSGDQQVGYAGVGGIPHASLWIGTAASWVDLTPVSATGNSYAYGVERGQQVGSTTVMAIHNVFHASLWSGTAASWVDLNPAGPTESEAFGVSGGQQVGRTAVAGGGGDDHASTWTGTAASWVDLHAFVPAGFARSVALSISNDPCVISIAGYGYNTITGREEALLWTRPKADFDGDGNIGTDTDIAAFFACLGGSCCAHCLTADFNNDGNIGTDADIEAFFLVLAGGGC